MSEEYLEPVAQGVGEPQNNTTRIIIIVAVIAIEFLKKR